jgi:hypothetical protein
MTDALDLSYYEKALDVTKIDSHTSQLTNLRLHALETLVDSWRQKVRIDPTQENIIGYYSAINTIISYLLSIGKEGTLLLKEITKLHDRVKELGKYWSFIKKGIESQKVKEIKKLHPKTYWLVIENDMINECDEIVDSLRKTYQSLNFYFRTSQKPEVAGVLGDIIAVSRRKNKEKEDGTNGAEEQVSENS